MWLRAKGTDLDPPSRIGFEVVARRVGVGGKLDAVVASRYRLAKIGNQAPGPDYAKRN